eukprot:1170495-Amphidinium_carterae.1
MSTMLLDSKQSDEPLGDAHKALPGMVSNDFASMLVRSDSVSGAMWTCCSWIWCACGCASLAACWLYFLTAYYVDQTYFRCAMLHSVVPACRLASCSV